MSRARTLARPLHDLVENRWATASGASAVLLSGLAAALLVSLARLADPVPLAEEELVFLPGTLARLGTDHEAAGATAAPPAAPTVDSPPPSNHVTTEVVVAPPLPPPARPSPPRRGAAAPSQPGGGKLPGPAAVRGNPLGSANGWDELVRDGDPWATDVLAALNGLVVRPFGGDAGPGTVLFSITVCKDGKHTKVARKGGSAAPGTHNAVVIAVEQLQLPRMPARIAAAIPGDCTKIRYTFEWSGDRVE